MDCEIRRRNDERREAIANLEAELQKLNKEDVDSIFNQPSQELLLNLKMGNLTAVQVLKAFQYKVYHISIFFIHDLITGVYNYIFRPLQLRKKPIALQNLLSKLRSV